MSGIFYFTTILENPINNYDLGALVNSQTSNPLLINVNNSGDRAITNYRIRVVAYSDYQNISGSQVQSLKVSSNLNPSPGEYYLLFSGSSATINGQYSVGVVADGVTKNLNIISGTEIVLTSGISNNSLSLININDGYLYTQITNDISGTPSAWVTPEVSGSFLFCQNMTQITGTVLNGGSMGQTTWYYVVTAKTDAGEILKSNTFSVVVGASNKSLQLDWETFPGALYYNIYKGVSSGSEKFLISTSNNTYIDNGTLGTQDISYPTISQISKKRIWLRIATPAGADHIKNPRRFRLRGIGSSA